MSAIVSTLTSLPFLQFRRNRYFYVMYDGFYALLCVAILAVLRSMHHQPLLATWDLRYLALLPFACYAQILSSVFIHNATHQNFPRWMNRLVGEICGVIVVTRFASWEVIHRRHHKYSDDVENDPHPIEPRFWPFFVKTVVGVEKQLQRIYFENFGDTPESRRYERWRAMLSFSTMVLVAATWHAVLGPIAFWMLFIPASLVGLVHLIHFNWSTHNGFSKTGDYRPVNLDHGLYKLGNFLCFGIYFHANHHRRAGVFNPAKMAPTLPVLKIEE